MHADLRPEDKATLIAQLRQQSSTAMVGDGVNDAPLWPPPTWASPWGRWAPTWPSKPLTSPLMGEDLRHHTQSPRPRAARPAHHAAKRRPILGLITILIPLALTGVLGLAAVVAVHELAEIVVIANGVRGAAPNPRRGYGCRTGRCSGRCGHWLTRKTSEGRSVASGRQDVCGTMSSGDASVKAASLAALRSACSMVMRSWLTSPSHLFFWASSTWARRLSNGVEPCSLGRFDFAEITSEAGVFVGAVRSVGSVAVAERDLALPEVLDEFVPFGLRGLTVLGRRPRLSAVVDKAVVRLEDIFLIDSGVAAGDLDVVVAHNLCGQVDGKAGVDDVGNEDPAEVMGREVQRRTVGVRQSHVVGEFGQPFSDCALVDDP